MANSAYQLIFPCPECKGMLTMHIERGSGQCPLCQSAIKVRLDVQTVLVEAQGESALGWDRRAFRRPADTTKPMWQSLHP